MITGLPRSARAQVGFERELARDRLLDEQRSTRHRRASAGVRRMRAHELGDAGCIRVLLVAVERGEVRLRRAGRAPPAIGASRARSARDVAADLELEIAVAVGGDHFLQRFRQAVVHALGEVGGA